MNIYHALNQITADHLSLFIQDCFDLYECLFCAHIVHQKFCIANMQFEEAEYFAIKAQVIEWILS